MIREENHKRSTMKNIILKLKNQENRKNEGKSMKMKKFKENKRKLRKFNGFSQVIFSLIREISLAI